MGAQAGGTFRAEVRAPMASKLRAAVVAGPRTRALIDGSVVPEGIDWEVTALGAGEIFARQLKGAEFDVSEFSLASYAIVRSQGDERWAGLPVFTARAFFHADIVVHAESPLHDPRQLAGARVGVYEYQQTSVVWIRGILQHHFGIDPRGLTWYMQRRPEISHGGATGFTAPDGIRLTYVPEGTNLAAMLADGRLDAILFYPERPYGTDAAHAAQRAALRTRTLFADPAAEGARFFAATGILPLNHGLVLRGSLLGERPELARAVYAAFVAARNAAGDVAGFPYGLEPNRLALETLLGYLDEQQLTRRRVGCDELFLPERDWALPAS